MISPSEGVLEEAAAGARMVMPLEFHSFESLVSQPNADAELTQEPESQRRADDAMTALEERFASQHAAVEQRIDETRRTVWAEAREALGRERDERVALERAAVIQLAEQFAIERTRYFADVEAEVVRLALAIAARVLHREAALDPLLLRGAVKVALEKVQEESRVTLRVPEEQAEGWEEIVAGAKVAVRIEADSQLEDGEMVLETMVGRVELGMKAQLAEIERGFFDLLERRPA